jgi:flagellar motor switch protein FliG
LVKALLFSFDDIARLTPADRVKLFDGVPVERTILALHGVAIELKDLILSSVSARSRRMIEQEISTGVVPPARNIDKARRAIADLVLEMAERGLIDISVQADAVEEPA